MKPYALVLGGGGARGAYQLGVWTVLRQLGIRFNAVIGTSVGALNGSFMVLGAFHELGTLWEHITLKDVVSLPPELTSRKKIAIDHASVELIAKFRQQLVHEKGIDTAPLRDIVNRYVDEFLLRKMGVDFGLVTWDMKSFKPKHLFLDDIPQGLLAEYMMATSALPGFKPVMIDGRFFVDGGVADNVPVDAAVARGYRRLIVVDLSGIGVVRRTDPAGTETVYIKNSVEMSHMLDFTPESKRRNEQIGRLDTLRIFGKLQGYRYFYRENSALSRRLDAALLRPEVLAEARKFIGFRHPEEKGTVTALRENLPMKMRLHRHLSVPFLECAALALGLDLVKEYSHEGLLSAVRRGFHEKERACPVQDHVSFIQRLKKIDPFDIFDSSRELLPSCYLVSNPHGMAVKIASRVFPEMVPAKIFRLALKFVR